MMPGSRLARLLMAVVAVLVVVGLVLATVGTPYVPS
jgi:hypothetical protein